MDGWITVEQMLPAGGAVDRRPAPETEETNYIEAEAGEAGGDRGPGAGAQTPNTSPSEHQDRKQFVSTEQMSKDGSRGPRGPCLDLLRDVTALCCSRSAGRL